MLIIYFMSVTAVTKSIVCVWFCFFKGSRTFLESNVVNLVVNHDCQLLFPEDLLLQLLLFTIDTISQFGIGLQTVISVATINYGHSNNLFLTLFHFSTLTKSTAEVNNIKSSNVELRKLIQFRDNMLIVSKAIWSDTIYL